MRWKAGLVTDEAHTWFAWYPICVRESNTWVWLEPVRRRLERSSENGASWYYRLPKSDSAKGVEAREVGHPAPREVGASQLHDTEISTQSIDRRR